MQCKVFNAWTPWTSWSYSMSWLLSGTISFFLPTDRLSVMMQSQICAPSTEPLFSSRHERLPLVIHEILPNSASISEMSLPWLSEPCLLLPSLEQQVIPASIYIKGWCFVIHVCGTSFNYTSMRFISTLGSLDYLLVRGCSLISRNNWQCYGMGHITLDPFTLTGVKALSFHLPKEEGP